MAAVQGNLGKVKPVNILMWKGKALAEELLSAADAFSERESVFLRRVVAPAVCCSPVDGTHPCIYGSTLWTP